MRNVWYYDYTRKNYDNYSLTERIREKRTNRDENVSFCIRV